MKLYPLILSLTLVLSIPKAAEILMITGNSNGTVLPGELSIGDDFLVSFLEDSLGHSLTLMADSLPGAEILAAANQADLVLLVESITSIFLRGKIESTTTAILNCEAFLQDDLGMTPTSPSGDPGTPDDYAFGVIEAGTDIEIVDSLNVLSAGMFGTVKVYSQAKSINWGKVGSHAKIAATLSGDARGATIYYYEAGDSLYDGTLAPGLRINFFLEDDNVTGSSNFMTPEALQLFKQSLAFGLGETTVSINSRTAIHIKPVTFRKMGYMYIFKKGLWDIRGSRKQMPNSQCLKCF